MFVLWEIYNHYHCLLFIAHWAIFSFRFHFQTLSIYELRWIAWMPINTKKKNIFLNIWALGCGFSINLTYTYMPLNRHDDAWQMYEHCWFYFVITSVKSTLYAIQKYFYWKQKKIWCEWVTVSKYRLICMWCMSFIHKIDFFLVGIIFLHFWNIGLHSHAVILACKWKDMDPFSVAFDQQIFQQQNNKIEISQNYMHSTTSPETHYKYIHIFMLKCNHFLSFRFHYVCAQWTCLSNHKYSHLCANNKFTYT